MAAIISAAITLIAAFHADDADTLTELMLIAASDVADNGYAMIRYAARFLCQMIRYIRVTIATITTPFIDTLPLILHCSCRCHFADSFQTDTPMPLSATAFAASWLRLLITSHYAVDIRRHYVVTPATITLFLIR